jgi:hypothetical protein
MSFRLQSFKNFNHTTCLLTGKKIFDLKIKV